MIDGIEIIYQRIANAITDTIPESWSSAKIEAVFYSDSSEYTGEYLSMSGKERDFEITMEASRAFREIRRNFRDVSQPLWGQALFELWPDGHFKMTWSYDSCDENGDTIWDAEECLRRHDERRQRLIGE